MTKDSKRRREVHAAQAATGRRYTALARELASKRVSAEPFTLAALLTECTTAPTASPGSYAGHWSAEERDYLPEAFASRVLGTAVPFGSILALAGALADAGREAQLTVESLAPLNRAVLLTQGRRLYLSLDSERCHDLCTHPHCDGEPLDEGIPPCGQHLATCTPDDLSHMAGVWGHWRFEITGSDPDRCGGAVEAEQLVKAAVSHGAGDKVIAVLLDSCFDDPQVMDHLDDAELMCLRHAIDRERLRLEKAAHAEVRHIREAAEMTCAACGTRLFGWAFPIGHPPEYCSTACAATAPSPQPRTSLPPSPWRYTLK